MIVLISIKIVLECTVENGSSDAPEMYIEKCLLVGFSGFCKLLRVSHHLKNHLGLVPGLQEHCCCICLPCADFWIGGDGVAVCLLSKYSWLPCGCAVHRRHFKVGM